MSDTSAAGRPAKLPLWRTLRQAYAAFLGNLGSLLTLVWPWLALMLVVQVAYAWWLEPWQRALAEAIANDLPPPSDLGTSLAFVAQWVVLLVPLSAMAIGWHRLLLRGAIPASGLAGLDLASLRRYVGLAGAIGAISYLPGVLFELVSGDPGGEPSALQFTALAASLVVLFISSRLSVAFPAIAVDGPGATIGEAWRATRRNTIRLTFGTVVALLPLMVLGWLSFLWGPLLTSRLAYAVVVGLLGVVMLLLLTISVGFWSFAWRHFFPTPAAHP